jgi:hypothetical protein
MDALKKSITSEAAPKGRKSRKAAAGQKRDASADRGKEARRKESGKVGKVDGAAEGWIISGASVPHITQQSEINVS